MRTGPSGHPIGLDYTAVMLVAGGLGADAGIIVDLLPAAEAAILTNPDEGGDYGDEPHRLDSDPAGDHG